MPVYKKNSKSEKEKKKMWSRGMVLFSAGFVGGIYTAQNYHVPNIKTYLCHLVNTAFTLEKTMRKGGKNVPEE